MKCDVQEYKYLYFTCTPVVHGVSLVAPLSREVAQLTMAGAIWIHLLHCTISNNQDMKLKHNVSKTWRTMFDSAFDALFKTKSSGYVLRFTISGSLLIYNDTFTKRHHTIYDKSKSTWRQGSHFA